MNAGERLSQRIAPGRLAYLHLIRGALRVNDVAMQTGDGAKIEGEEEVSIAAGEESELLFFDLG